jgi:L-iditol 2-dehydrogenase
MEPTAIVVHGIIEKHQIVPSDTVVIIGPGPVGILAAQVARAVGARKVLVLGTNKDEAVRLKLCRELGFTTYNVEKADLHDILSKEKCKDGVDVVVECAGSSKSMTTAVEITRKNGTILALGIPGSEYINIPWAQAVKKGIAFKASYSSNFQSWEKAIPLLATKKIDTEALITGLIPLEQWEDAFNALSKGEGIKCLITPNNRDF